LRKWLIPDASRGELSQDVLESACEPAELGWGHHRRVVIGAKANAVWLEDELQADGIMFEQTDVVSPSSLDSGGFKQSIFGVAVFASWSPGLGNHK